MNELDWIRKARHGGAVQRTHTVPTIQQYYSVAEHTFNAIIIAKEICKDLDWLAGEKDTLDEYKIFIYLLKHDLAESYTGDMPANVKKETAIKDLLDLVEKKWEHDNVPREYKWKLNDCELWVAKMADSLELAMFCIDEYDMGNRHRLFMYMLGRVDNYVAEHAGGFPGTLQTDLKTILAVMEELRRCL